MRARKHGLAIGLFVVFATSVPALAQSANPPVSTGPAKAEYPTCNRAISPSESDAAHTKYLSGKVDYDEGKYDAAIGNFRAAYEKDCTKHELLVIISRSYELNNNLPEAIRALEVYLERQPGTADATTHKTKLANMREKLAQQKAAAATPPPSPSGTNGNGTQPPATESSGHTVYPWILVGAGVVTTAVGVVLLLTTPSLPPGCDEKTKECTLLPGETKQSDAYVKRRDEAGRSVNQPVAGAIVTAAGGALIVGGLVWYFLEPTGPKETAQSKRPRVSPQIGQGFAGLAWTGRF